MGKIVFIATLIGMGAIALFREALNTPWDWPILLFVIMVGAWFIDDLYVKQTFVVMWKTREGMKEYNSWWKK